MNIEIIPNKVNLPDRLFIRHTLKEVSDGENEQRCICCNQLISKHDPDMIIVSRFHIRNGEHVPYTKEEIEQDINKPWKGYGEGFVYLKINGNSKMIVTPFLVDNNMCEQPEFIDCKTLCS